MYRNLQLSKYTMPYMRKGRTEMITMSEVEYYWRQKIADEISEANLKDGEWPSSDWCAATLRTQMVCASIARGNNK